MKTYIVKTPPSTTHYSTVPYNQTIQIVPKLTHNPPKKIKILYSEITNTKTNKTKTCQVS